MNFLVRCFSLVFFIELPPVILLFNFVCVLDCIAVIYGYIIQNKQDNNNINSKSVN